MGTVNEVMIITAGFVIAAIASSEFGDESSDSESSLGMTISRYYRFGHYSNVHGI